MRSRLGVDLGPDLGQPDADLVAIGPSGPSREISATGADRAEPSQTDVVLAAAPPGTATLRAVPQRIAWPFVPPKPKEETWTLFCELFEAATSLVMHMSNWASSREGWSAYLVPPVPGQFSESRLLPWKAVPRGDCQQPNVLVETSLTGASDQEDSLRNTAEGVVERLSGASSWNTARPSKQYEIHQKGRRRSPCGLAFGGVVDSYPAFSRPHAPCRRDFHVSRRRPTNLDQK